MTRLTLFLLFVAMMGLWLREPAPAVLGLVGLLVVGRYAVRRVMR